MNSREHCERNTDDGEIGGRGDVQLVMPRLQGVCSKGAVGKSPASSYSCSHIYFLF